MNWNIELDGNTPLQLTFVKRRKNGKRNKNYGVKNV